MRDGIGFCLLVNSEVAAQAFAASIIDNFLEIGIETSAKFRGKGYAQVVASSVIDYCIEHGLTPVWACRYENIGSYKVAQKLGFQVEKLLPYYKLNGSPRIIRDEIKPAAE